MVISHIVQKLYWSQNIIKSGDSSWRLVCDFIFLPNIPIYFFLLSFGGTDNCHTCAPCFDQNYKKCVFKQDRLHYLNV